MFTGDAVVPSPLKLTYCCGADGSVLLIRNTALSLALVIGMYRTKSVIALLVASVNGVVGAITENAEPPLSRIPLTVQGSEPLLRKIRG